MAGSKKLAQVALQVPTDAYGGGGGRSVDVIQVVGLRPLTENHPLSPVHTAIPPVLQGIVAAAVGSSSNLGPPLAHLPN